MRTLISSSARPSPSSSTARGPARHQGPAGRGRFAYRHRSDARRAGGAEGVHVLFSGAGPAFAAERVPRHRLVPRGREGLPPRRFGPAAVPPAPGENAPEGPAGHQGTEDDLRPRLRHRMVAGEARSEAALRLPCRLESSITRRSLRRGKLFPLSLISSRKKAPEYSSGAFLRRMSSFTLRLTVPGSTAGSTPHQARSARVPDTA